MKTEWPSALRRPKFIGVPSYMSLSVYWTSSRCGASAKPRSMRMRWSLSCSTQHSAANIKHSSVVLLVMSKCWALTSLLAT
eukprot:3470831-Pyramimonas_sp.AAC.1